MLDKRNLSLLRRVTKAFDTTIDQLATFFEVTKEEMVEWMESSREVRELIETAQARLDTQVVHALAKRAIGYQVKKKKVLKTGEIVEYEEELPPSEYAIKTWLFNRRPDEWKDSQEVKHTGEVTVTPVINIGINEPRRAIEEATKLPDIEISRD